MGTKIYIPEKGDILWVNFNPTKGHEQKGHRPALVLTPRLYNEKTGLMVISPITSTSKGYPFEVEIKNSKIKGVILSDQLRTLDWKVRGCRKIIRLERSVFKVVVNNLLLLLGDEQ